MLYFQKKELLFDINRCCQCGGCIASCPNAALVEEFGKDGLWHINWKENDCSFCGKCVSACPAHVLPNQKISNILQRHVETFLSYAKDEDVRNNASSGGVARTLIAGSLKNGIVESAYALIRSPAFPWAEGSYLNAPISPSVIANSMYLPVLVYKNFRANQSIKSILLIGTPCQLIAAEKLIDLKVQKVVKVAIFCKQQKNLYLTKHLAARLNIAFAIRNINNISYRGEGWPGKIKINNKSLDWELAAALPYGKKLWRVPGCLFCPNPLGSNVDITLADPWGIEESGKLGKTLVFAWSKAGIDLLHQNEDSLCWETLNIDSAMKSIDLSGIKQKQELVGYYLGNKVSLRQNIRGICEKFQVRTLEGILNNINLPSFILRALSRMPNP